MNNDRISKTPGGERMLVGVIVLCFGILVYSAARFHIANWIEYLLFAVIAYGAIQFVRGLFQWKYTDHGLFARLLQQQNLYIDIPLANSDVTTLHVVEDALIEALRNSRRVSIKGHTVDTVNNVGTIHLHGGQADAVFSQIFAVLGQFSLPGGLHIFPKQGQQIDTAINGKRVLMDMPKAEVIL